MTIYCWFIVAVIVFYYEIVVHFILMKINRKKDVSEFLNITVTCVDKLDNCANYARGGTCSKTEFAVWVKDNCARTCLCCKYVCYLYFGLCSLIPGHLHLICCPKFNMQPLAQPI